MMGIVPITLSSEERCLFEIESCLWSTGLPSAGRDLTDKIQNGAGGETIEKCSWASFILFYMDYFQGFYIVYLKNSLQFYFSKRKVSYLFNIFHKHFLHFTGNLVFIIKFTFFGKTSFFPPICLILFPELSASYRHRTHNLEEQSHAAAVSHSYNHSENK